MSVTYFVKHNCDESFCPLESNDRVTYTFDEMRNGKLVVVQSEKVDSYTKVSKLCFKGKNWYKIIENEDE